MRAGHRRNGMTSLSDTHAGSREPGLRDCASCGRLVAGTGVCSECGGSGLQSEADGKPLSLFS